jgi:hypothetical protein
MPYPQDLVGKYINYRVDQGGSLNASLAASMVNGVLPGQTTAATNVGVYNTGPAFGGHRAAAPAPAMVNPNQLVVHSVGAGWSFTFLKYIAGAVTIAPIAAGGIMTGPMSGCYLCKYTEGSVNLAHIGTANDPTSDATIDVKNAWKAFVARPAVLTVSGASPFEHYSTAEINASVFGGRLLTPVDAPMVVGYFDMNAAYAILLAPVPAANNPPGLTLLKVAGVKTMTLQPWATIAALSRFTAERSKTSLYDPSIIRLGPQ